MFRRVWLWLGHVTRVRSLLQWFGWWEGVVSALSGATAVLWSRFAGLAGPEQFVLSLFTVLVVLGVFAVTLHLFRASPRKTIRALDVHGNVWMNPRGRRLARMYVTTGTALLGLGVFAWTYARGWSVLRSTSPEPLRARQIAGEVVVMFPWPACRFYQNPPQHYQSLDTELLVSVTNRSGHDLYIRAYSVEAMVDGKWIRFKNAEGLGVDQFSFGFIDRTYKCIRHFDLFSNGFDYVMQQRPLRDDESLDMWMFFKSGLAINGKAIDRRVKQFMVSLYDSANDEYSFTSTYPTKRGTTITIPNPDQ